jgi:mRNA-degrading endonuclease RelE of RelBE toxin-antitoxin system
MTPPFKVEPTTHFDRLFRKLARQYPELPGFLPTIRSILQTDPYNRSGAHPIKKLVGTAPGDGQYRLRLARFRFRYDIEGQTVYLKRCSLRREDTYN